MKLVVHTLKSLRGEEAPKEFGEQNMDALQKAAIEYLIAYDKFCKAMDALPETNQRKMDWDYLDWHSTCAAGPSQIARHIALDEENAEYEWTLTFCDKRDRTIKLGTRKLASLTGKQASDMAHMLAGGRGWNLEKGKRTTPVPAGAESLV